MKKILFLSIFISLNLYAQNLAQILESLQSSSKVKSIVEKSKADVAQNEQFSTYEAASLSASISHADSIPLEGEDGTEYSVAISQDLHHPFSSSLKDKTVNENTKAIKQETKHDLHILELDVVSAYHSSCVSQEMQEKALFLYTQEKERFLQIQKAYELGEIAKKDLLFNKLDLVKLQQNISSYKRSYLLELSSLQLLIDNLKIQDLHCTDLFQPKKVIVLNSLDDHGELKVMEYKKNSARAMYGIHDSLISSFSYEFGYERELDTKRYTFGLSIPLDGMSSLKEKSKAEQLALSTSYLHEKDSLRREIQDYSYSAVEKIEVLYDEYTLIKNEILPLNKELLSLSKMALLEGEGSLMEYLDSTRSYSLNVLEMLEIKKIYYVELFELYKIADLEYGEEK